VNPSMARSLLFFCPLGALGLVSPALHAQTPVACNTLSNVVYMQVGDTQEPLMKSLGRKLRDNTANPITIVYSLNGSCTNIEALYTGVKLTTAGSYIPSTAEDATWDTTKAALNCSVGSGVDIDIGVSATFVGSCNSDPPPTGIRLFTGPVQPYVFVVPVASTQKAITAEEGYFVFGYGAAGMVEPWTNESLLAIRAPTKSTLLTLAAAIGVQPANKAKGIQYAKSSDVLKAVSTSASPEATIGMLGAEIADAHPADVTQLAFRAFGQRHAYYPNSTSTSFDKQNVRDGHYLPWSPTVYIAPAPGGIITNPLAKYIIDIVTSKDATPAPNFDGLGTLIGVNLIPDCAMHVKRPFEGADLSLYSSAEPCDCFYRSKVGTVPASCTSCTDDGPCGTGKCRHQFCEAR
jgi:hypothetical protein